MYKIAIEIHLRINIAAHKRKSCKEGDWNDRWDVGEDADCGWQNLQHTSFKQNTQVLDI